MNCPRQGWVPVWRYSSTGPVLTWGCWQTVPQAFHCWDSFRAWCVSPSLSGSGSLRISFHFIPRTQWDKFYYQSPVTEKLEKFNTVFKFACFANYQVRFWTQVWLTPKPLFLPTQLPPSCVCRIKGVGGGGAQCRVTNWQRAGQIQLTHVLIGRHGTFGCQYLTIRVHTKIWFSTCL